MRQREGQYTAQERVTIAESPTLRVRKITLRAGECVPWHVHSQITDRILCIRGPVQVMTRLPDATHVLNPGDMVAVEPGVQHRVSGVDDGPCQFLAIQGVGEYDYIPSTQTDSG